MKPHVARSPFCNVQGCDMPVAFYPVISIWAKGHPASTSPMHMELGVSLCHDHKDACKISDFPGLEDLARRICADHRLAEPDFSTAKLNLVPI